MFSTSRSAVAESPRGIARLSAGCRLRLYLAGTPSDGTKKGPVGTKESSSGRFRIAGSPARQPSGLSAVRGSARTRPRCSQPYLDHTGWPVPIRLSDDQRVPRSSTKILALAAAVPRGLGLSSPRRASAGVDGQVDGCGALPLAPARGRAARRRVGVFARHPRGGARSFGWPRRGPCRARCTRRLAVRTAGAGDAAATTSNPGSTFRHRLRLAPDRRCMQPKTAQGTASRHDCDA